MSYQLKNSDPEDVGDVLGELQKSFGITFQSDDFRSVKAFGELCTVIRSKIDLIPGSGCTYQQAFYKLRSALVETGVSAEITPNTRFESILPLRNRRKYETNIDKALGVKTKLLGMPEMLVWTILISVVLGFVLLFFNREYALKVFGMAAIVAIFGSFLKNSPNFKTVGELCQSVSWRHYSKIRRDSGTVNPDELDSLLSDMFAQRLGLDKVALRPDSELGW